MSIQTKTTPGEMLRVGETEMAYLEGDLIAKLMPFLKGVQPGQVQDFNVNHVDYHSDEMRVPDAPVMRVNRTETAFDVTIRIRFERVEHSQMYDSRFRG